MATDMYMMNKFEYGRGVGLHGQTIDLIVIVVAFSTGINFENYLINYYELIKVDYLSSILNSFLELPINEVP